MISQTCLLPYISNENRTVLNENRHVLEDNRNVLKESRDVLKDVENYMKTLVKQSGESRSDDVLNKHLVWFNFQREIESNNAKFTTGSREWVFEQVLTWFN